MKTYIIFFFALIITSTLSAKEIRPRILIIPVENQVNDEMYNNICTTIDDIMLISMKLMGQYEVVTQSEDKTEHVDTENALVYAEEHFIDNIIFGSLDLNESGHIVMDISLYEASTDSIVISPTQIAMSFLDIFDAADKLIAEMLGFFSDDHIGFGSISLNNSGESGEYRVFFNGSHVGDNIKNIPKVLNGNYLVEIRQDRFEEDRIIYSKELVLKEKETVRIDFSVPYLTEEEQLAVLAALPKHDRPIYDFLFLTGVRVNEATGLQRKDTNWDRREQWRVYPPNP